MRILLDTQIVLWAITDDQRLPSRYRDLYLADDSDLFLSAASIWEILIKCDIGKLVLPRPVTAYLSKQLARNRITLLGIQMHHLAELEGLPPIHKDPFDRMIAAQSKAERMPLLTSDRSLAKYAIQIL